MSVKLEPGLHIRLSGPHGTGKTWLANVIMEALEDAGHGYVHTIDGYSKTVTGPSGLSVSITESQRSDD